MFMALNYGLSTIIYLKNVYISHGEKQLEEFDELTKEHIMCWQTSLGDVYQINLMLEQRCLKVI